MADRYKNIILYFEENEDHRQIANRMVLLYMNRFTIDEDQRFEISGVFTLSKVPEIERNSFKSLNDAVMKNWSNDQQIVYNGFKNSVSLYPSEIAMKIHTHLIIGTSIYGKYFYNNSAFKKYLSIQERITTWSQTNFPSMRISVTVLDGEKHELFNQLNVKDSYRTNMIGRHFVTPRGVTRERLFALRYLTAEQSLCSHGALSDDLENFYEKNCKFKNAINSMEDSNEKHPFRKVLFLYEYLEDSEKEQYTDIRTAKNDEYLLSICTRTTVTLNSPPNFFE